MYVGPHRGSVVLAQAQALWRDTRELIEEQVLGLILLGTSMDYESVDSRSKGCWDPLPLLKPFFDGWTSDAPTPDFVVEETWCKMVGAVGFGTFATEERVNFWTKTLQEVYRGDEGRKKVRMALTCLLERDGLLLRLVDIKCPVYWLQVRNPSLKFES